MDANPRSRKATLLVSLVFILGIALGSVGTYVVTSHVQAARPQTAHTAADLTARLTKELDLTPDQQKQVQAIVTDVRTQYAAIHAQADPEYEQARQQGRERIRQILTPEQKPKFEEWLRKVDEERAKRESDGH